MSAPRVLTAIAGAFALLLSSAPAAAADEIEVLQASDCAVDIPAQYSERVSCSILTVPESRVEGSDPAKVIQLPVAVIESRTRDSVDDPLVFPTSGGPGGGSLDALWYFLEYADWAGDRDIIVVEQRGDRLSDPTLNCPELDIENFIVDGVLASDEQAAALNIEQLQACHDRLVEEGVNLAAYTSAESAADLADLRTALGYDEWNLYGLSYGARLALTVMRDRPDGLRSVILDGVLPVHLNRHELTPAGLLGSLDTLVKNCDADAQCGALYPDLAGSLAGLLERAEREPLSVTIKQPADRSPFRVDVSDTDLMTGLFGAFYDTNVVRVLPYLIDRLERGDDEAVVPLAQRNVDYADIFSEGLMMSVECGEEVPFTNTEALAAALEADPLLAHFEDFQRFADGCPVWAMPPPAANENDPVASAIPTLLMSGGYDPVTPPAFSEAAAQHLSSHYRYDFPGVGHGALWADWDQACAASIAEQFLQNPRAAPDSSCIAELNAPDFLTSKDIQPTSAIYRFNSDVIQDRDLTAIAIAALSLLVFLGTLIYAAVYGVGWLNRRRGEAPGGAVLAAATSSGLNLIYAAGLAIVMTTADPLLLAFGLPSGVWPLLIVPFGAIAAAILLIVLVVRAWMRTDGTLFHRVVLSISAIASVVFAVWLLTRGLLLL